MNYLKKLRTIVIFAIIFFFRFLHSIQNRYKHLKLRRFKNAVISCQQFQPLSDCGLFAIFVYYEPDGEMSLSVENILRELQINKINTLLVSNHSLTNAQLEKASKYCHEILVRQNVGYDFGAYKDAVSYLLNTKENISRIIFLNDSVFYFSNGLKEFVKQLLSPQDVVSAFENWEVPHKHHLQSFALSVSAKVFQSSTFVSFWRQYRPVSDRLYCIERGEKVLSQILLNASNSVKIIYPLSYILDNSEKITNFKKSYLNIIFPKFHRMNINTLSDGLPDIAGSLSSDENVVEWKRYQIGRLLWLIERGPFSPIHVGAYFFAATGCPIVKKDLIYRGVFELWQLEVFLKDIFHEDEVNIFLSLVRRRGNVYSLNQFNRLRFAIGSL